MSEHDSQANPDPGHPHSELLPHESKPQGAHEQEKPYSDFEGAKAGKGGDHPTHGAGPHDDPNH